MLEEIIYQNIMASDNYANRLFCKLEKGQHAQLVVELYFNAFYDLFSNKHTLAVESNGLCLIYPDDVSNSL